MLDRPGNVGGNAKSPRAVETGPLPEALPVGLPESAALGDRLSVAGVAALLGCSTWTVRHRLIPQGLPHWRTSQNGKYLFYASSVRAWWWGRRQRKGG
jgi:hypothetical protein